MAKKRKKNKPKSKQTQKKIKAHAATGEVATEEVATEEVAPEEVATEEVATEEVATEEVATEEVATEEVATEGVATEGVAVKAAAPVAPGVAKGYTTGKLVGATAMCVAFALGYTVLITPYANAPVVTEAPTTVTTTAESTTVTTTETTTVETTTRKIAAPVTKPYRPKTTAAPKVTAASKKVLLTVPYVSQLPSYPTGCEAASATMLLKYYGYNVGIRNMISAIPRENLYAETLSDGTTRVYGPSIYHKFVGDPSQKYTSETPGYGAFAPVVTSAMNSVINRNGSKHVAKNITGSSVNTLLKYIDEGHPVIVWSTAKMKTPEFVNSWYIKTESGDKYFEYPRGTHVTVLIGYDSAKIYMADPYYGDKLSFSISDFSSKYSLLGKQAIVLVPKEVTSENLTLEDVTTAPEDDSRLPGDEDMSSGEDSTSGTGTTDDESTDNSESESSDTTTETDTTDPEEATGTSAESTSDSDGEGE